jgi:hypothetical protein
MGSGANPANLAGVLRITGGGGDGWRTIGKAKVTIEGDDEAEEAVPGRSRSLDRPGARPIAELETERRLLQREIRDTPRENIR